MNNSALAIPLSVTIADQYSSYTSQLPSPVANLDFLLKADYPIITLHNRTQEYRIAIAIAFTGDTIQQSNLNKFIKQTLHGQLTKLSYDEVQKLQLYAHNTNSKIEEVIMSSYDNAAIDYTGHKGNDYQYLEKIFGKRNYVFDNGGIFNHFNPHITTN